MEQNKIQNAVKALTERSKEQTTKAPDGKKGRLVVIDSKPPVADNTTLMLCMLKLRAVDEGRPAAYFSLTLSNVQVCNRLIAITTGIDLSKIDSGELSEEDWKLFDEKVPHLMESPLFIDDTPKLTLLSLHKKAAGLAADHGVKLIVIDHAQLLTDEGEPDADLILSALKAIAEDLGVTIFAVVD